MIAESELNRAQLFEEMTALTAGVRTLTNRAKSFGSIASIAAVLVAGLAAIRRSRSAPAGRNPLWWRSLLKGWQLAGTLWSAVRPRHE